MSKHADQLAALALVNITVERYDHTGGQQQYAGMRGTCLSAETRFTSGRAFSTHFPDVFVSDNGEVDLGDLRIPSADALAWLRKVADHIEARMDAS